MCSKKLMVSITFRSAVMGSASRSLVFASRLLLMKTTRRAAFNMLGRQWADVLEPKGVAVLAIHRG